MQDNHIDPSANQEAPRKRLKTLSPPHRDIDLGVAPVPETGEPSPPATSSPVKGMSSIDGVDPAANKMMVFLTGKPLSNRSRKSKAIKFPVKVSKSGTESISQLHDPPKS